MRALYHHRTQGKDVEAVHIVGLCGGLEQLGFEVEIVGPPGVVTDPESTATPAAGKPKTAWDWVSRKAPQAVFELLELAYNVAAFPRLWRRCRAARPDLLYERYALYNFSGVLAGRLAGIPTVLEVNDTSRMDRTRQGRSLAMPWLARWFERRVFAAASALVPVSGYLRDQLLADGVPPEKVRVTPNAVDAAAFDPSRTDGAIREEYGLDGTTVIGFVGSFAKWHGPDLLLRAFASLAPEFPEARLLLVGDGARRGEAERLATTLGVRERVVFTGKVGHSRIPAYVAAMDVGVMPSSNLFGSPVKVFEYMAMGRPAVAPRYQPLEEAIREGETGLLFEPGSLDGLTASLRTLLADASYRERLGEAAREHVLSRHQWVHNARTVLELAARSGERPSPEATAEGAGATSVLDPEAGGQQPAVTRPRRLPA